MQHRPHRAADHRSECLALGSLAQILADSPALALQAVADTLLHVLAAGSAGVSLLSRDGSGLVWQAVAGEWQRYAGTTRLRGLDPCGAVIADGLALLFTRPENTFPALLHAAPVAQEFLVAPFYIDGHIAGALWAASHGSHEAARLFDGEDLRQLTSLCRCAAAAAMAGRTHALQHDTEERCGAFLTAGSDVVYRMNADWSEMRQLVGRNFIADTGAPDGGWLAAYIYPEDQAQVLQAIGDAIARQSMFEMAHRVMRIDGSVGWTIARAVPLLDGGGLIVEWVGFASDVTASRDAARALASSEARYRSLFESMDEGYCLIDVLFDENDHPIDFTYLEVNPAFEKLTGMHGAEGKRVREFFPDLETAWFDIVGSVALTGEPVRTISEAKPMHRWFDLYCFQIKGNSGRSVAVLFNNITERRRAEAALLHSEALYRDLFNSIDEGFCVIEMIFDAYGDAVDYLFLEVNPIFAAQCNLHDAPGRRMREISPAHEDFWFEMYGKVALTGVAVRVQAECTALQGWFDIQAFRVGGPGSCKVAVIFNNITERRSTDQQLQAHAHALADLDRRKDEFLALLSHELRNPLAALATAAQLLRSRQTDDAVELHACALIERQVGRLKYLVDDLLEISRITSGRVQLHLDRVELNDIVARAVETTQPAMATHRHTLTVMPSVQPLWLHADAARLEQVVVNLLANAAKYTDARGHITLTVEQEGQEALVRVHDNGIGIEAELLPRIFELFSQADRSLDRSQGGLGIGLCLVQRLVILHGGSVAVASTLGESSEFIIRLPIMALEQAPLALPPYAAIMPPAAAGRGINILVVDDNEDLAQSLAMLLELEGHEVRTAHDGPAALEAAAAGRPQVMLLDIGLPGLDGFEVARRIRQSSSMQDVVLVAMTGCGQEADRQRSLQAGFDYHLVKPAEFAALQEILAGIR
ncbi:hybrid sensor histidine kinase/response regulator [Massilia sp. PWRC2]|uniref:hybrid sensor histidine kinase/response regulator n=1 Tax=Massilia sp. PWRC2 TaxID=2804626 RepID=UPI003CEE69BA